MSQSNNSTEKVSRRQQRYEHKVKKAKFRRWLPLIVVVAIAVVAGAIFGGIKLGQYVTDKRIEKEEKPIKDLLEAARAGDAKAQFEVSSSYINGYRMTYNEEEETMSRDEAVTVKVNNQKGVEWLEKSAKQDYIPAMINFAQILANSSEVDEAIKYYEKAIEKGSYDASILLAALYLDEENHTAYFNVDKAVALYEKEVEKGKYEALLSLATIYLDKEAFEKYYDVTKAISILERAATEGKQARAYFNLGIVYSLDDYGVKDFDKAIEYHEKAVAMEYYDSYAQIAYIYETEETKKDIAKAIEYYTKASEKDITSATYQLGVIYYEEEGFKDLEKAKAAFTKLKDAGITDTTVTDYLSKIDEELKK